MEYPAYPYQPQFAAAPSPLRGPSAFAADPMPDARAQRFTCAWAGLPFCSQSSLRVLTEGVCLVRMCMPPADLFQLAHQQYSLGSYAEALRLSEQLYEADAGRADNLLLLG
ncbi:hypothetical protein BBJ28_00027029, partial [Nothophytophthora sp. Chile5]